MFYSRRYTDGRADRLRRSLNTHFDLGILTLRIIDVYIIEGLTLDQGQIREVFVDTVAQEFTVDAFAATAGQWSQLVEIAYRPGVTDTTALTARDALRWVLGQRPGSHATIQTARQYLFGGPPLTEERVSILSRALHNPLIQQAVCIDREQWSAGGRPPCVYPAAIASSPAEVKVIEIAACDDAALTGLSKTRLLALSLEEMQAIREEFGSAPFLEERRRNGLSGAITDVELEMIAQTWSEHCKHKIFNAMITYRESGREEMIDSFFDTFIRQTTKDLAKTRPYLKSVFHDNSGVIGFDDDTLVCFKVETHNSPSALDPYGGAITGIVGVNRDIMGTGKSAKPIFNTNVLCFGPLETSARDIPAGLLHPRQVMEGVHRGIVDGGNQSGIPTVGGAFLFDESFLGKPLVFCGTGGILPAEIDGEGAWIGHIDPGDLAVMVGGRIGKDGIHGATFSSQALDETSPTSAVQIGDPITQKKMLDFLLEARDRKLFRGITDNGAGGLSSSLGEMAEKVAGGRGGVRIDLHKCPLKYPGLSPWEILVSESQERMSLAVSPHSIAQLNELASRRDVEATVVGVFTDSGYIDIRFEDRCVGLISCCFLHQGLPRMHLLAEWRPPLEAPPVDMSDRNLLGDLISLLSDANIASKETLVRQYDHEVQARSVVGPFVGAHADGASDGAVLRINLQSRRGITVTHGVCPRYGDHDTYRMALCAVDEAYRAHVGCGGDPDLAAALDNFCWPDPLPSETNPDSAHKLAQLVRAGRGLREACLAYGLPLISGKDSMKNDTLIEGRKVSVRPTLLISLVGIIQDVRKAVTTDFKSAGHLLFVLGETRGEMGGSAYERLLGRGLGPSPLVRTSEALPAYRRLGRAIASGWVASSHDLSEGGLAVAVCESALGGRLGAEIHTERCAVCEGRDMDNARLLFCETPSRMLLSVAPENAGPLQVLFDGLPLRRVGRVTAGQQVRFRCGEREILSLNLQDIERAWKHPII